MPHRGFVGLVRMSAAVRQRSVPGMNEDDQRARRRDEEDRESFAIRREEREMAAEIKRLQREEDVVQEDVERAERTIDADLRVEGWGRDPERLPFWRSGSRPPT